MGIKPFDIITGVFVFALLVWLFSGMPCEFPSWDTGMYFPSSAGTQTEHRGKGVAEPAAQPPTEPKETEPKPKDKPQASTAQPEKDTEELAYEVIRGLWACGSERERRMTAAGHDYPAIQQRVNEIIDSMETPEPEDMVAPAGIS